MTSKKKGASDTEAPAKHRWVFNARFRRHAFGWRSQAAVTRVKEAVAEIKAVSFVRREMSHPAGLIGCCRRRG